MSALSRIKERFNHVVARARERSGAVDHLFRTVERYLESFGGRLAAGIAYYGFFATFAFGVLAFSVLGFLVDYHVDLRDTVDQFLTDNIPVVDVGQISAGRGAASVFGLVGLLLSGLAWVEALRSSQRLLWQVEPEPGSGLVRRALDVVVLVVLALLLGVSFALAVAIQHLLAELPAGVVLARVGGVLLTIGVNVIVAVALLAALPRLRISARRLLPPAVVVAVGLYLLNTLGLAYIDRVRDNPAYSVVATAAGLLVYLYLFHQLLLGAAAWAATSRHGHVVDMARGSKSSEAGETGGSEPSGSSAVGAEG